MSNKNQSNKRVPVPKPGSVEDAAKALKESQQGEDQEGVSGAEDLGAEEKPGEDPKGAGEETPGAVTEEPKTEDQEGVSGAECSNMVDLSDEQPSEGQGVPVPSPEQCEGFAKVLANSPEHLAAFRSTLAMAEAIIAENSKGKKKTVAELEVDSYNRLVATYGKDFVTAKRGTNSQFYSRKTWNAMKNKRGWVEVTKTMPEVQSN